MAFDWNCNSCYPYDCHLFIERKGVRIYRKNPEPFQGEINGRTSN